jgi:disulfide bond formation protein DsbB
MEKPKAQDSAPLPKRWGILSPLNNLVNDFWGTLGEWERGRVLWFCGGLSALALELFSYFYYQRHLALKPCEYCVLIRLAMWGIALGGLIGGIYPKCFLFKLPGYLVALISAIWGLVLSIKLENINLDALKPDFFAPCQAGVVHFPFGLPMDKLMPTHFKPSGECGVDTLWSFFGFTMTQLLIMVYLVYILGLIFMLIASIMRKAKEMP